MLKFWARASGSGKPSFGLSAKVTQNAPSGWAAQAPGGPGRRAHRDRRALNGPGAYRLPRLGPAAPQSVAACKFHWCFWSMGRHLASFLRRGAPHWRAETAHTSLSSSTPTTPLLGGFFAATQPLLGGPFRRDFGPRYALLLGPPATFLRTTLPGPIFLNLMANSQPLAGSGAGPGLTMSLTLVVKMTSFAASSITLA